MPEFRCVLAQAGVPLEPVWEHTVGSGHASLALRADWQAQLRRCREGLGIRHVRFHGLLDDAMSTFVVHDGRPVSSFFNADQIWDFLLSAGVRPFVELGFTPTALASGSRTVFHDRANVTPPSDYAAEAIKRVGPDLRVGGPATANEEWSEDFLDFCEREGLPADFVSTHTYPTDAFGQPADDTERQLAQSRRGLLRERAQDTARRARGKPVYYTEWNASSNPAFHLHDRPYAAAFAVLTIRR